MSSALEIFRAQRAEVEQIHARLTRVEELLRAIRSEANVLAHDQNLRMLLQDEQTWLRRAEDLMRTCLQPITSRTETNRQELYATGAAVHRRPN